MGRLFEFGATSPDLGSRNNFARAGERIAGAVCYSYFVKHIKREQQFTGVTVFVPKQLLLSPYKYVMVLKSLVGERKSKHTRVFQHLRRG